MLVIRGEQMQAFRTQMLEQFVERLTPMFIALWPKQTSQLGTGYRRFIVASVDRAISYGIDTESSVGRFVNLCLVWGAEFEMRPEHAWALRILKDSSLRGAIKVNELAHRTTLKLEKRLENSMRVA
jgi:hypothetical protein